MIYTLPHCVDRAAERAPERDAFRAPGERLCYGELAARANRLARWLVAEGVRRGDRVGVFLPRSVDTAVAIYGIMKAGAAFVPLDPHLPPDGLKTLLVDCGIEHLVTDPDKLRVLAQLDSGATGLKSAIGPAPGDGAGALALRLTPWAELDDLPGGSGPDVAPLEDDLAYIMYSSGSTGRPKGIMHTHRSGLAYAALSVHTYGVGPDDRIGNHAPLHFDMSTFGYFSAPYAGATTVVVPEAYTKLAASLSQLMQSERLTFWYSVPLALIQLLTRGVLAARDLSGLRWVLFGGEPFPPKHLRELMARWPQARFSNVYGPAEVNQCTYYHVPPTGDPRGGDDDDAPVPIGRTWDNTEGLVLGDDDQPVAPGEVGELAIRSATMMRGYWGRPDRTAASFYRPPSDDGFERVFYRTGDLVQTRDDGELVFLGRKDRQRKVRGYRVELDEVERTLATHDAVEEAAVFPAASADGSERLEAAVTLRPGAEASPDELLRFLKDLVSWYAVPAALEVRSSFPRTTSGKIDRRKLQAAESAEG